MEEGSPEIRTYFWVGGDSLDPQEFSQIMGFPATDTGIKGDPSPHPALREQGRTVSWTYWKINVSEKSYNTNEVIQKLL